MVVSQLPVELLDDICQYLLPADLAALSRAASSIQPIAQRILYRHLSVSALSQNLRVVITLAKKPKLAQHVRTLTLRLDCTMVLDSFYRLIASALSNMTELTSLDLFVDSSASWILLGTHRFTYPRLLHFASSFSLDSHVATFLSKTEALVELELHDVPTIQSLPTIDFPVESIPRLCQFFGSPHAANVIVPGRPVESIHLHSGDLTESDIITLAKSSAQVSILGATTSSLPLPLLEALTRYMPHLVYLRMMTTHNFSDAPDATFYEQTGRALGLLSNLKGFELAGMHWGSSQKAINDERRVWQSQPLINEIAMTEDVQLESDGDFYSDLFFTY